jgi:hypothetical protein
MSTSPLTSLVYFLRAAVSRSWCSWQLCQGHPRTCRAEAQHFINAWLHEWNFIKIIEQSSRVERYDVQHFSQEAERGAAWVITKPTQCHEHNWKFGASAWLVSLLFFWVEAIAGEHKLNSSGVRHVWTSLEDSGSLMKAPCWRPPGKVHTVDD